MKYSPQTPLFTVTFLITNSNTFIEDGQEMCDSYVHIFRHQPIIKTKIIRLVSLPDRSKFVQRPCLLICPKRRLTYNWEERKSTLGGVGIFRAWSWYRCAAGASNTHPIKCIVDYGKTVPINVYPIMEDNKKCSLFPFGWGIFMQKKNHQYSLMLAENIGL